MKQLVYHFSILVVKNKKCLSLRSFIFILLLSYENIFLCCHLLSFYCSHFLPPPRILVVTWHSIKWKQVNNKDARVIFPAGLDSQAKRVLQVNSLLNQTTLKPLAPNEKMECSTAEPNDRF